MANENFKYMNPSKKAGHFAKEIKEHKHLSGPKKGQELSTQEFLFRSGYLRARRDSADVYNYKKNKQ